MVKPVNKKLTVKKEPDLTSVKIEKVIDDVLFVTNDVQMLSLGSQVDQLKQEKANIIQELVDIKSENQKLNFELQTKCDEIQKVIEQRIAETTKLNNTIQSLQNDLIEWKQKCSNGIEMQVQHEKAIRNLNRENHELSAQLVQLRRSTHNSTPHKSIEQNNKSDHLSDNDDDVFEVEAILSHKVYRKKRSFYVRWKNYSPNHDSWVNENNINCDALLDEYLTKNNLK